jgi:pimeloyl-ACP methyl ester carboxylesterase
MTTTLIPERTAVPMPRFTHESRVRTDRVAQRRTAVLAAAACSGVLAAALIPRGPTTGTEVVVLTAGLLMLGGLVGAVIGARWAALAGPAAHLAGYELARSTALRVDGPTLGRPRFDVTMGVLVFFATHVMYAAIAVAAMALGGILGVAATARRERPQRWPGRLGLGLRRGLTLLLAAGLGWLVAALAWPAAVPPVVDGAGRPVPGSVAALEKVRLGGVDQWISIRGSDASNPVLLHLSGGPGSSDVGWVRTFNQALEEHFTVVVWEQRGTGKSYPALDPTATFTLDRVVADGIELSDYLAGRFHQPKIYLTGNSWGSTLGVLMVQRRPDLYYAYAGTGQMVSQRETDRVLYRQLLDHAARTGDAALLDQLRSFGEPPYRDVLAYAKVMEYYDVLEPYQHSPAFERAGGLSGFFPGEYSLLDTWNEVRGFADMGGLLYPQLQGIDFRVDVPRLAVPVYFMQGRHELTARSRLADEWIQRLEAPIKRLYWFESSGHNADAEEPARYNDLLINVVLPETHP